MDLAVLKQVLALPELVRTARRDIRRFTSPTWERCGTARGEVLGGLPAGDEVTGDLSDPLRRG
jgi:hypothetical protein